MDLILFVLKYTPFWAIPFALICGQFAYIYWLKSIRTISYLLVISAGFCFLMTVFYYWVGGPEKIGPFILDIFHK